MTRRARLRRRSRAQALVEFALVVPWFFLMLFGILQVVGIVFVPLYTGARLASDVVIVANGKAVFSRSVGRAGKHVTEAIIRGFPHQRFARSIRAIGFRDGASAVGAAAGDQDRGAGDKARYRQQTKPTVPHVSPLLLSSGRRRAVTASA